MQNLPFAKIYEKEFKYMSWGKMIDEIIELANKEIPQNAQVLDIICGPGYLVNKIKIRRPDLNLTGVDLEPEFIQYAKNNYSNNQFILADALTWENEIAYDAVFCTGGLHHIPYDKQELFIERISKLLKEEGIAIVGDPYIDDYDNEQQRKIAGAKLGHEYLVETINNGATDDVIAAAADLIKNDVLAVEFKSSVTKIKPLFEKYFSKVILHKTWPAIESGYGDYYFILAR